MTTVLTVTAKGQVTLRKSVREHLGIGAGDKVEVTLCPDGRVELRAAGTRPPLSRLRGILKRPGQRPISIKEMQDAIEKGRDR